MKKIANILIIGTMTLLFSCAKDGETGPAGPAGANGTNGTNGTVDITTTEFTVTSSSWTMVSNNLYSATITDPAITDQDKDLVMIYGKEAIDWYAIPTINFDVVGDALTYSYLNTTINLFYQYTSAPTFTSTFKVVVIPYAKRKKNVDYGSYSAVKEVYNLHD
jgi:hypothetical protein